MPAERSVQEEEDTMAATARRSSTRLIVVILVIVGLLALAAGIYYFTTAFGKLLTWFSGYLAGSTHHYIKRAIAGVGVAVLCGIGVWFVSGRRSQIGSAYPRPVGASA